MSSIIDLVLTEIASRLQASLQDAGLPSQELAIEIRPGLAQQNPVTDRISVFLHHGDPDDLSSDPTWVDRPVGDINEGNNGQVSGFMIGGARRYWRAFVVEIKCYFIKTQETRDNSRAIAANIFSRAQKVLMQAQALPLTDDFGETSIMLTVDKFSDAESGGPPKSFIWRGKIFFRVLTETSPL